MVLKGLLFLVSLVVRMSVLFLSRAHCSIERYGILKIKTLVGPPEICGAVVRLT